MRKQYLIMFWAVLGLIACVPIGLLTQPSFNSYTGPEFIVSTSRTSFLLFFIGGTLITGIYALTAMWENGENFSQRNVVLMILTATCAALFLYPFVYDPLYYHLAARSVNAGVNPYLFDFSSLLDTVPVVFNVVHTYAYGPIWLFITTGVAYMFSSQFSFLMALKVFALVETLCVLLIYKQIKPKLDTYNYALMLLNPALLLFGLSAGLADVTVGILFFASLVFLVKDKRALSLALLSLAILTKPTLIFAVIPYGAFLISKRLDIKRVITYLVTLIPLGITGYLVIANPDSLNGMLDLHRGEQETMLSFGGVLGHILSTFTGSAMIIKTQTFFIFVNGLFILFYSSFIILKKPTVQFFIDSLLLVGLTFIYFSGYIVKPWYIIPFLFGSLLASEKIQKLVATVSILLVFGVFWFNISPYFATYDKTFWLVGGIFFSFIAPVVLIVKHLVQTIRTFDFSAD